MELLLLMLVLQLGAVVCAFMAGRNAEAAAWMRRVATGMEARMAEYEASDRGPVASWTFGGYLRAVDDIAGPPRSVTVHLRDGVDR